MELGIDAPERTLTHELLDGIAETHHTLAELELAKVQQVAHWANLNTISSAEGAATLTERGLDTGLPVAGEGAPLISDFAIIELAPILGRSLDSARSYVGCVVELSHRLPNIWAKAEEGLVPVWKALRIADQTRLLNHEAVGFVDHHLAPFVAGCSWAQIDRLVEEAITRFQPDLAEARRRRAEETRRFDIDLDHAGTDGVVAVDGVLDTADALDLERAVSTKARELAGLGDEDSLDVRRAKAVGEIARDQLTLDLTTLDSDEEETGRPSASTGRGVELFVHLTDTALTDDAVADEGACVGRLQNLQVPITVEQIRAWCGAAGRIIVRPVLDLAGCEPIEAYEVPDRHRRIVVQRDHHCVFPGCTKRAERCDVDHIVPHAQGGVTCPCNEAALCRGHHRAKTHAGWSYERLAPTVYLWTSPSQHRYLVTAAGTRALDPDDGEPGADPPEL
ncbi:HNH endonuclease signature motif containing protein [Nocardioides sp. TF02-7]|uniref:HNH endonuclease signature motif containing protein n=1 Tax=Nocardioides sp. TF02-7 TaxID=2917724 RepID=UPI001F062611|nr:HNH endonuclease signature motif containing protein [Nocardioides sp. TF02-7]UMG92334.1 HNH endonuclease [Nocardioides sp. TF02-7]